MSLFRNKKIAGFTLIETIIVLLISTMIIVIPAFTIKNLDAQVKQNQVVNSFKVNFNQATKYAVIKESAVLLKYNDNKKVITFSCGSAFVKKLTIPKEFNVKGFSNPIYISQNGTVTPRTITFKRERWSKVIKIQMKWGQLIESD